MKNSNIRKITQTGLYAAIIFVMSQFIKIPLPLGYANMGDCFVIMSGWYIGGIWGCAASMVGSLLSDAISGYIIYIPASVVIKGLMAFAAHKGYQRIRRISAKQQRLWLIVISAAVEALMVGGYFAYETMLYGYGGALVSLPGNLLQGMIAIITCNLFYALKIGRRK